MTKINHYIFVVDQSESMQSHDAAVQRELPKLIDNLSKSALSENQDARFSLYYFNHGVKREIFDTDARLIKVINTKPSGMTAIYDALGTALKDHTTIGTDTINDHSFIVYLITDGQENKSQIFGKNVISSYVNKDNWSFLALVPDSYGKAKCLEMGFSQGNVDTWDTNSSKGFEEASLKMSQANTSYITVRSAGMKKSDTLFNLSLKNVSEKQLTTNLSEVNYSKTKLNIVTKRDVVSLTTHKLKDRVEIKTFVERKVGSYVQGKSFYKIVKPEFIQPQKNLAIRHKGSGKIYEGPEVRDFLKLPDYEVKVNPLDNSSWDIFVQSTSTNRHLFDGDEVLTKL